MYDYVWDDLLRGTVSVGINLSLPNNSNAAIQFTDALQFQHEHGSSHGVNIGNRFGGVILLQNPRYGAFRFGATPAADGSTTINVGAEWLVR